MRSVLKFLRLPAADQALLLRALAAVTWVRLRLAVLPFRPGVGRAWRHRARRAGPSPERIAWAVDRVGSYLGNATCLARALAAQRLFGRHGFSSRVSIGVVAGERRENHSDLIAHAWLEFRGQVLVGGPDIGRYTPLLSWCH